MQEKPELQETTPKKGILETLLIIQVDQTQTLEIIIIIIIIIKTLTKEILVITTDKVATEATQTLPLQEEALPLIDRLQETADLLVKKDKI